MRYSVAVAGQDRPLEYATLAGAQACARMFDGFGILARITNIQTGATWLYRAGEEIQMVGAR